MGTATKTKSARILAALKKGTTLSTSMMVSRFGVANEKSAYNHIYNLKQAGHDIISEFTPKGVRYSI